MTIKTSIAAAVALALACGTAMAEFKDFTVNGQKVTVAQQQTLAKKLLGSATNPNKQALQDPGFEGEVKQILIESKVMSDYAVKQGIDKLADVKNEIQFSTQQILANHAIAQWLKKNPVTEKEIKAEYDKEKNRWGDKEVRIRHILVKDKKQAENLIARINKGESFAKLAAENSTDMQSRDAGGILDWTSPSVYTGNLQAVVKGLKKGQLAKGPVTSPAGYHVVKLEDVRAAQLYPDYKTRKVELQHLLLTRKVQGFVKSKIIDAEVK